MSTISQLNSSLYFNSTNNYIYIQTGYNDCLKFSTPSDTVNFLSLNSLSGTTNVSNDANLQAITSTITNLTAINITGVAGNITGAAGLVGIRGFQGNQGIQGFQGFQGFQGVQGVQGAQGFQSIQGIQGYMGGFQGNQGPQGSSLTVVNFAAGRLLTSINDNSRVLAHTGISFTGTLLTVGGNISATGVYIQSSVVPSGNTNLSLSTNKMINFVQNGNVANGEFATRISGLGNEAGTAVSVDNLGNSYVAGYFTTPSTVYNSDGSVFRSISGSGNDDCFIVKYGNTGMGSYFSKISGASIDRGLGISTDTFGNAYVTGRYTNLSTIYNSDGTAFKTISFSGGFDSFVVKYGTTGMGNYVSRLGAFTEVIATSITVDGDGNSYVTGYFNNPLVIFNSDNTEFKTIEATGVQSKCFIVKYGPTGIGSYATKIDCTDDQFIAGYGIAVSASGTSYVVGRYTNTGVIYNSDGTAFKGLAQSGAFGGFIASYGPTGMAQWVSKITSTFNGISYAVACDDEGNSYVTGYSNSNAYVYNSDNTLFANLILGTYNNPYLVKYGSTGMVIFANKLLMNNDGAGRGVTLDRLGNSYITGNYRSNLNIYNSDNSLFGTLTDTNNSDNSFIIKYGSTGMGTFATKVGEDITATTASGNGISVDLSLNVYNVGLFTNSTNIYNSNSTIFRSLSGSGANTSDAYIVKYNSAYNLVDLTNTTANNGKLINVVNTDTSSDFIVNLQTTGGTIYDTRTFTNANAFVFYNGRWYPTKNF